MHPILFEILGFRVHAYGLMMAVACASALALSVWRARREGMNSDAVYELATWLFLGGVIGARVLFVVVHSEAIRSPLDVFRVWEGGGVFYGCILGGLTGTLIYYRRHPFPFLKMADVVAPTLAIGAFFGRIGCHLNGCCYGSLTQSSWGIRFPQASHAWVEHVDHGLIPVDAPYSLPVLPTQLYAAFSALALFAILMAYYPRRKRPGQVMALLMIAYPVTRWPVEMLRADDPGVFAGVTVSMLISLLLCAAGIALWVRLSSDSEDRPTSALGGRPAHA